MSKVNVSVNCIILWAITACYVFLPFCGLEVAYAQTDFTVVECENAENVVEVTAGYPLLVSGAIYGCAEGKKLPYAVAIQPATVISIDTKAKSMVVQYGKDNSGVTYSITNSTMFFKDRTVTSKDPMLATGIRLLPSDISIGDTITVVKKLEKDELLEVIKGYIVFKTQ